MRLLFSIIFLFFGLATSLVKTPYPVGLQAQEIIEDIGFGVELYPHLSSRRLLAGNSVTFQEVSRIDSLEKADFGYGIGVFYAQRIERIGFHLGLRYLVTGYQTNDEEVFSTGQSDPTIFSQTYTAQLLEVPFQLNFYQNFGANTSFYFTLGAAASIHLKSVVNQSTRLPGGTRTEEELDIDVDYRTINYGMIAAMGIERRFNKMTIGLQPTFEYWLGGNIVPREASDLNRNLYNVGLRMTAQFSTF